PHTIAPAPQRAAPPDPRRDPCPPAGRAARRGDPEPPVSALRLPIPHALCGSHAGLRDGAPTDNPGTARTLRGVPPLRLLGTCWHGRGSYTYNAVTTGVITIPRHGRWTMRPLRWPLARPSAMPISN